ncbi:MAG: AraC family transcriptional regulator [Clostridia bacterium]|nr:AraC family transcriptional regulator [Clostridia bacterium]
MDYQKLLTGREPYFVNFSRFGKYHLHRHHEIELSYCVKDSYVVFTNDKKVTLCKGDLLIVPPMCPHAILDSDKTTEMLTLEFGREFLGEYYEQILKFGFKEELYHLENIEDNILKKLRDILEDIAVMRQNRDDYPEMFVKGNLYLVCGIVCKYLLKHNENALEKMQSDISKIDSVLDYLYNNFDKPLTVKEISIHFGYSESNFCKIFKNLTGTTFHSILNQHRTDVACEYLSGSNLSIEEIALKTGFADAKSFCRVFKKIKNQTPGNYRKATKTTQI